MITENSDGTRTEITGTAGIVESPNYPQLYPGDFSHTWTITVPEGSTVQLHVTDLKTELDTDMLTVCFILINRTNCCIEMSNQLALNQFYSINQFSMNDDQTHN